MTTTDKEKAAWFILDKTIFTNSLNVATRAVRIPRLQIVKDYDNILNHA